jgi:hypothetical protein
VREIDPGEEKRPVDLGVTPAESGFLALAIDQWGGPASPTDEIARLTGFGDAAEMREGLRRIGDRLVAQESMSRRDWRRALVATELVSGSDTHGAGVEWQIVSGRDDCESLGVLRELQRKLVGVCPR